MNLKKLKDSLPKINTEYHRIMVPLHYSIDKIYYLYQDEPGKWKVKFEIPEEFNQEVLDKDLAEWGYKFELVEDSGWGDIVGFIEKL